MNKGKSSYQTKRKVYWSSKTVEGRSLQKSSMMYYLISNLCVVITRQDMTILNLAERVIEFLLGKNVFEWMFLSSN